VEPTDKWIKHDTNDENLEIASVFLENDSIYTTRGRTIIKNGNVDDLYEFFNTKHADVFEFQMLTDKMCTESKCLKNVDNEHSIIYSSFSVGYGMWPRDFCYIRRRFKYDDYEGADGKKYKLVGDLSYSVDKKHPCYVETKEKHVRGFIKMSGSVFVQKNTDIFSAYIVNVDPNGWIPNWIINAVAPEQGMVVKNIEKSFPVVLDTLKKRKEKLKKEEESKEDV